MEDTNMNTNVDGGENNSEATWYYEQKGKRNGPVTSEEMLSLIKNGTLSYGNRVWNNLLPDWTEIEKTELWKHLQKFSPPPLKKTKSAPSFQVLQDAASAKIQALASAKNIEPEKKKKLLIAGGIAALILAAAVAVIFIAGANVRDIKKMGPSAITEMLEKHGVDDYECIEVIDVEKKSNNRYTAQAVLKKGGKSKSVTQDIEITKGGDTWNFTMNISGL